MKKIILTICILVLILCSCNNKNTVLRSENLKLISKIDSLEQIVEEFENSYVFDSVEIILLTNTDYIPIGDTFKIDFFIAGINSKSEKQPTMYYSDSLESQIFNNAITSVDTIEFDKWTTSHSIVSESIGSHINYFIFNIPKFNGETKRHMLARQHYVIDKPLGNKIRKTLKSYK